ncbi:MAG: HEAT repeat domain-containing protein, partial [Myxococcota bacterium]
NGSFPSLDGGGGASERVHQIRRFGADRSVIERSGLCDALEDLSPAVRRNAAWALGNIGKPEDSKPLLQSAMRERCDMPRFAKCVAAVRCGADVSDAWQIVERFAERSFDGFYGVRKTAATADWGLDAVASMWCRVLTQERSPVEPQKIELEGMNERREFLLQEIAQNPDNRDAVLNLGLLGHPDDFEILFGLIHACGRRMHLTLCAALGYHGDPRAKGWLLDVLHAMDENPGHGFASRAAAASGLGCMGLIGAADNLVQALHDEARDFEGRPGAGLGIQRSVRTSILGALGELQRHPNVLESYLSNTDGCATGGFYLSAMDGLWKIGNRQRLVALSTKPAEISVNAAAVLQLLDDYSEVDVLPVP